MKNAWLWLSSGLIAVVVSFLAITGTWIVFKALHLDHRLGVDEGICLLAVLVGPALIRVIHRSIIKSYWIPKASLAFGLTIGGLGVWQILRTRDAMVHHVSSGLFSGIENLFNWAIGLATTLVAVLAVLGGTLALAGRKMNRDAEPNGPANGSRPIRLEANRTQPADGSRR